MKKLPVISGPLNRVTDTMPEVQNSAFACPVALIFRYDFLFYLNVATNELLEDKRSARRSGLPRLKLLEHFRIGDNRVLDDLGESLIELAPRQSF